MMTFIEMAKDKNLKDLADTICATGGGAYKFENDFRERLDMELNKIDELGCLLSGIHFLARSNPLHECYYFVNPSSKNYRKEIFNLTDNPYPFLVVNIGSGVSILSVTAPNQYKRVSGSR